MHAGYVGEAMEMARDAIGLMGIDLEDDNKSIPEPNSTSGNVEKNCTILYWMSAEADKRGINYSRVLQEAIANIINNRLRDLQTWTKILPLVFWVKT